MNNTELDPSLSVMLEGTNLSISPGAFVQQQPLVETDTASSHTRSAPSKRHLCTPETNDDDYLEEELVETPKKPNTRSKSRTPVALTKSKTTPTKAKQRGVASGTADKRRKRNLERNRVAASKCRQRKKQWQDGLESKKTELESRYKALHSESKELMEQVAQLKNFVMTHAACNDTNIDNWIRNEADVFVRRLSTAQMHTHPASAAPATAATGFMAKMQSPPHSTLTADLPMNEFLAIMFAASSSNAPFDKITNFDNNPRPDAADTTKQTNNIFDQDLLMVTSMQA